MSGRNEIISYNKKLYVEATAKLRSAEDALIKINQLLDDDACDKTKIRQILFDYNPRLVRTVKK